MWGQMVDGASLHQPFVDTGVCGGSVVEAGRGGGTAPTKRAAGENFFVYQHGNETNLLFFNQIFFTFPNSIFLDSFLDINSFKTCFELISSVNSL